jgi:hypothetical protein
MKNRHPFRDAAGSDNFILNQIHITLLCERIQWSAPLKTPPLFEPFEQINQWQKPLIQLTKVRPVTPKSAGLSPAKLLEAFGRETAAGRDRILDLDSAGWHTPEVPAGTRQKICPFRSA